jgi:hypothetical protein
MLVLLSSEFNNVAHAVIDCTDEGVATTVGAPVASYLESLVVIDDGGNDDVLLEGINVRVPTIDDQLALMKCKHRAAESNVAGTTIHDGDDAAADACDNDTDDERNRTAAVSYGNGSNRADNVMDVPPVIGPYRGVILIPIVDDGSATHNVCTSHKIESRPFITMLCCHMNDEMSDDNYQMRVMVMHWYSTQNPLILIPPCSL